jgi:hypothetical protein
MKAATEEHTDETTDNAELTKAQEEAEAKLLRQIEAEHAPQDTELKRCAARLRAPSSAYLKSCVVR